MDSKASGEGYYDPQTSTASNPVAQGDQAPPPYSAGYQPPPPPQRARRNFGDDDPSNPIHYTRDPHKLTAYLVPFPKPRLHTSSSSSSSSSPPIPQRFLIYTPPPPPLTKPDEGEKEARIHKIQRKWQEEVRSAKTSTAKTASWHGVKSKATKGIAWAMSQAKTANLEFLNRIGSVTDDNGSKGDKHADDGVVEGETTKKTVGLEEMVLVYPSSVPGTQEEIRTEFVNSMLRSKSKAQRDAIIATGLLPVSAAIDILATVIWPFGGLLEIDSVWLYVIPSSEAEIFEADDMLRYSSIRGAKISRSTTKRLTSTNSELGKEQELKLNFVPSTRLEILEHYLASRCHERDAKLFASSGVPPTETDVLEAIGWSPSHPGGNWEDEQWEITEVKDDMRSVMSKGAKEYDKWTKAFEKNPERALKK
ncbi:MAG: hypothetical protein M1821_006255 [Bathelium mastoideum]|nr:MAG: hypothetical protein M1821_006255 [Bathelium mastoideum]KAI9686596.1 MAG: hypothetical protein M1822_003607 [Bathelium mastoideum]